MTENEDPTKLPQQPPTSRKPKKSPVRKKDPTEPPPPPPPKVNDPERNPDGTWKKGHTKTAGIQLGQKHHLSLRIQNTLLELISKEFDSERFYSALQQVYAEDPAKYLQALQGYMKFAAPTLQAQSLEIQQDTNIRTSLDDRLDDLMNNIQSK